jgi:hypothetical protein
VKFTRSPENYFSPSKAFEGVASEVVILSRAELEGKECQERSSESYEHHIYLESHQKQQVAYQKYSEFFHEKVDPVIGKGKLVVQDIEENVWVCSHLGSKEHSHMLQRKVQEHLRRVSDLVEELYRRKAWAEGKGLLNAELRSL